MIVAITLPPCRNSTLATVPSESDAVASRRTVASAVNVAPFAGEVSVTVGGTFGGTTVIVTGADVVAPLRLSVATAVNA